MYSNAIIVMLTVLLLAFAWVGLRLQRKVGELQFEIVQLLGKLSSEPKDESRAQALVEKLSSMERRIERLEARQSGL